jgi:hypothetical protein
MNGWMDGWALPLPSLQILKIHNLLPPIYFVGA